MPIAAGGSGTLPDWAPDLTRVANYAPSRTLRVDDTTGTPLQTFTTDTRPSAAEVSGLIEDAVAWVVAKTSATIDTSLFDSARTAAAIRTAGWVEATWPIRPDDLNTGQTLLTQADAMLTALAARNDVLIGQDPEVFELVPVWSFPPAEPFGDWPIF